MHSHGYLIGSGGVSKPCPVCGLLHGPQPYAGFRLPPPAGLGMLPPPPFGPPTFPYMMVSPAYPPYPSTTVGPPSDRQIAHWVHNALRLDPRISPTARIAVEVKRGVVTLRGRVPSAWAEHAAVEDALWVLGVVDVESAIRVGAEERRASRT